MVEFSTFLSAIVYGLNRNTYLLLFALSRRSTESILTLPSVIIVAVVLHSSSRSGGLAILLIARDGLTSNPHVILLLNCLFRVLRGRHF